MNDENHRAISLDDVLPDPPEPPLVCEDCGSTEPDVEVTICPYASDIHDRQDPATLCNRCYSNRCDEI